MVAAGERTAIAAFEADAALGDFIDVATADGVRWPPSMLMPILPMIRTVEPAISSWALRGR